MNGNLKFLNASPRIDGSRLKRALRGATVAAAVLLALPAAQAGTIAFEGIGTGFIGDGMQSNQGQFTVTGLAHAAAAQPGDLVGAIVNGADPVNCLNFDCPTNNSSAYYAAFNGGSVALSANTAQHTFQVAGFDASAIGPAVAGFTAGAAKVRVQGTLADGVRIFEDFSLAGRTGQGYTFAHHMLSQRFASQQFVDVAFFGVSCGANGQCVESGANQFALDNIAAAVPEPSSYLMLGLGLLAIGAAARRRTRAVRR